MKHITHISLLLLLLATAACKKDSPKPTENNPILYNITAQVEVQDIDFWPQDNPVVFEFYKPGDKTASFYTKIGKPEQGNTLSLSHKITAQERGEYTIKLSIMVNKIKKVVLIDYGTHDIQDNYQLENKDIEIINMERLHHNVFSQCIACHGDAQQVAANLYLTRDSAYVNLVNRAAVKANMMRVSPFKPDMSFITKVLNKDIDFQHTASNNVNSAQKELIRSWIRKGAPNR